MTAIVRGGTISLRAIGLDYYSLSNSFEYFNLAFYSPIRWACSQSFRTIDWGIGSEAAKASRGATLVPTRGLVRG